MQKIQEMKFSVEIEFIDKMEFKVKFDVPKHELILDETKEVGGDEKGPSASRLLASAIGNCLSASLIFCMRKSKIEFSALKTFVNGKIERDENGLLRIKEINVELLPKLKNEDLEKLNKCKEIFEKYCIVTESVRKGIKVNVWLIPNIF